MKLRIIYIIICLSLISISIHAQEDESLLALRFDMGSSESPLKPGWIPINHDTLYPSTMEGEYSYGWIKPASSSFDRSQIFVPDWMKGSVTQRPPIDDMLRDGVFDKNELTFRIDVPDGEYWLLVSMGDEGSERRNMSVVANGNVMADNITTQTSWGGYATTRTFRQIIQVLDGKVEINFKHEGDGNSILGIELISFAPYPVWFEGKIWQTDEDDANLHQGLNALNRLDWQKAMLSFDKVPNPLLKAAAFATLADLLDTPEEQCFSALQKSIQFADHIVRNSPPDSSYSILASELKRVCESYLKARQFMILLSYGHAASQTGYTFSRRLRMADDIFQQITPDDPLYDQACLNIGRIHYWFWRENGEQDERQIAQRYFNILKSRQPYNRLIRIYTGEKIPWGKEYSGESMGFPDWAVKQREAMGRLLDVVRWWIDNRQLENGEMGGGYGDDVEMLRQWHVFLGGADDETVRRGWLKLAHGIWYNGNIATMKGYASEESDVQHSAEDVADSQPAMIGLDYRDPVWLERCTRTVRTMGDFWTGVNEKGHRHFKSASIGANSMKTDPPWSVDIPCNGRATRPGLWAGWYNRNPELVKIYTEWMDAWVEDIMREENGKPAGVVPAAIAYETDNAAGYGKNWYEPNIYWDYFNWPGYVDKIYDHLLAAYDWTGDEKYLKPIEAAMEMALEWSKNPVENPEPGSREWAARAIYGFIAPTIEKYRILTGSTKYDEFLKEHGSGYMRYLLTGDKSFLINGCENAASSARFNFELKTSEVLFTDRVGVTQSPMWEMLTGGVGKPYYYPCHFVTWQNTASDFAALVASADSSSLKVIVCNFKDENRNVGMDLWRLEPGIYQLSMGPDRNGDDQMDREIKRDTFQIYDRGKTVQLELPPHSIQVIQITKKEEFPYEIPAFYDRPDLAIGDQDVFIGKFQAEVDGFIDGEDWIRPWEVAEVKRAERIPFTVIVHNLGKPSKEPVNVKLMYNRRGSWVEVDSVTITEFISSDALDPGKAIVELGWKPTGIGEYQLIIQVEYETPQMEITHRNNVLVKQVKVMPR